MRAKDSYYLWPVITPDSYQDIPLPMLVTGLPGVPGWALFRHFSALFPGKVIGIRPQANTDVKADFVYPLDAEDFDGLRALFETHRFRSVVDASGNCALKACTADPRLSRMLNYGMGAELARLAAEFGCEKYVRVSSDFVFSGSEGCGGYHEESPTDPITNNGKDMLDAESEVLRLLPHAAVLRIALPMDYAPGGLAGAIDWIVSRFRAGRPATLYYDEVRSPLYGEDLCRVARHFLESDSPGGVYHCGGPRLMSLYEVGQVINAVGGFAPELLQGCFRVEAGPFPPRVGHLGMNCEKIHAQLPPGTLRPWPLQDELCPTDRDWHREVDRSLWGGGNKIHDLLVEGKYIRDSEPVSKGNPQ